MGSRGGGGLWCQRGPAEVPGSETELCGNRPEQFAREGFLQNGQERKSLEFLDLRPSAKGRPGTVSRRTDLVLCAIYGSESKLFMFRPQIGPRNSHHNLEGRCSGGRSSATRFDEVLRTRFQWVDPIGGDFWSWATFTLG